MLRCCRRPPWPLMTFRPQESRFVGWNGSGFARPTWYSARRNSRPNLSSAHAHAVGGATRKRVTRPAADALFVGCELAWSSHHRLGHKPGIGTNRMLDRFTDLEMIL